MIGSLKPAQRKTSPRALPGGHNTGVQGRTVHRAADAPPPRALLFTKDEFDAAGELGLSDRGRRAADDNLPMLVAKIAGTSGADALCMDACVLTKQALARGDRDAARHAVALLDQLVAQPGAVYDAQAKSVRRALVQIANAPARHAPRLRDARAVLANLVTTIGRGKEPSAGDARAARAAVDNPKAYVTRDSDVGDFRTKGAHVHVRVDGRDLEIALSVEKKAQVVDKAPAHPHLFVPLDDDSRVLRFELVRTLSSDRATAAQGHKAIGLVAMRLLTDGGFRHQLQQEISGALIAARSVHSTSQQLPGAKRLERLLASLSA